MEIRDSEMFSRYYLDKDALDKQFKSARTSYEREAIRSQENVSNINLLMTAIR